MSLPTPTPFKISVDDDLLDFINTRVRTARLPPALTHTSTTPSSYGLPHSTITSVTSYWANKYDWRATETRLNSTFNQFTLPIRTETENLTLHFAHHRSPHPSAIPLLFIHGWPGSFLEAEHIIPLLTNPTDPAQQPFHVVAPSLPGFGFSSAPENAGFTPRHSADALNTLMASLGYPTYIVQAGDWGSMIARIIALNHPTSCIGVHVNFPFAMPPSPLWNPLEVAWLLLRWFTPEEKERFKRMMWWRKEESGYSKIMGTKPMTVSVGLVDSPVGMAAWLREKMDILVDGYPWSEEETITWAMMYVIPGSSAPANLYKEGIESLPTELLDKVIGADVYFGVSIFPKEVMYIPLWWAKCKMAKNIVFWEEHEKGGHFPSIEVPEVLVADIRKFVGKFEEKDLIKLVEAGKEK